MGFIVSVYIMLKCVDQAVTRMSSNDVITDDYLSCVNTQQSARGVFTPAVWVDAPGHSAQVPEICRRRESGQAGAP